MTSELTGMTGDSKCHKIGAATMPYAYSLACLAYSETGNLP